MSLTYNYMSDSTGLTKYFALGNYEKEIHLTNGTRDLYYINTPSGLSAIYEKKSKGDQLYYVLTDLLGSYDVICDEQGVVLERLSFDPWGRRRNPVTWDYTNVPTSYIFDRGFTGHEHLSDFELINMNGRVYDPLLATFLSPDNFVQSPENTQNLNRYAYCLNNPLKYTDPDGEWFITALFMLGNMYLNGVVENNFELNPTDWEWDSFGTWYSLGQGAISGYVIGSEIEEKLVRKFNSILDRVRKDSEYDMLKSSQPNRSQEWEKGPIENLRYEYIGKSNGTGATLSIDYRFPSDEEYYWYQTVKTNIKNEQSGDYFFIDGNPWYEKENEYLNIGWEYSFFQDSPSRPVFPSGSKWMAETSLVKVSPSANGEIYDIVVTCQWGFQNVGGKFSTFPITWNKADKSHRGILYRLFNIILGN